MIVDAVLYPFLTLIEAVAGLWPSVSAPVGPGGPSGLGLSFLAGMQGVADVAGPLSFLVGLLAVVPVLLSWRFLVYLYRLTPGKFS